MLEEGHEGNSNACSHFIVNASTKKKNRTYLYGKRHSTIFLNDGPHLLEKCQSHSQTHTVS